MAMFTTFTDRFADWPVNVEMLSRFRSASRSRAILTELAEGKTDVILKWFVPIVLLMAILTAVICRL